MFIHKAPKPTIYTHDFRKQIYLAELSAQWNQNIGGHFDLVLPYCLRT